MKTDWNNVAAWYDQYLAGEDTYQAKVIAPNLVRLLDVKSASRVLDVACGQGYFSRLCVAAGATVVGVDQSSILVEKANGQKKNPTATNETYVVGNAEKISALNLGVFDTIFSVLSFENIKNISKVMNEINASLTAEGKVILVLLHPAFRIPQHSDWGYDMKKVVQYRKTEKYLSEITIPIELTPFKGVKHVGGKSETTVTFHRSLQWYMKTFRNAGFAITNVEEWISHKKSEAGPRQQAEDTARKEIPMFMALELRKF